MDHLEFKVQSAADLENLNGEKHGNKTWDYQLYGAWKQA